MPKDDTTNQDDDVIVDISGEELSEEELLGLGKKKAPTPPPPTKQTKKQAIAAAAAKFHIPLLVKEKYPDLVPLIIETESMDDEEREYWFQILPIMTEDQIDKFRKILLSEKAQLEKLDAEYEQELAKINQKHLIEWKEFETKQKQEEITAKEVKAEKAEVPLEEDLLKKLQEL